MSPSSRPRALAPQLALVLAVALALVVAPPVARAAACSAAADCGAWQACIGGTCVIVVPTETPCSADADCSPEGFCGRGVCHEPDPAVPLPAAACAGDEDCADGASCDDGRCRRAVAPSVGGCAADADCGAGGACVWGECLGSAGEACAADEDCGDALVCVGDRCEFPAGTCTHDAACGPLERCERPAAAPAAGRGWCLADLAGVAPDPACDAVCAQLFACASAFDAFAELAVSSASEDRRQACGQACSFLRAHPELRYAAAGLFACLEQTQDLACDLVRGACGQPLDLLARAAQDVRVVARSVAGDAAAGERIPLGAPWARAFGVQDRCVWGDAGCVFLPAAPCDPGPKPDGCFAQVGPADAVPSGGWAWLPALLLGGAAALATAARRRRRRGGRGAAAGVLLAALLLPSGRAAARDCAQDADCGAWSVCLERACATLIPSDTPCAADADCAAGGFCGAGACFEPDPQAAPPSFACAGDADCVPPAACRSGACARADEPRTPCVADEDCGPARRCAQGLCRPAAGAPCAADGDCAPEHVCAGCHCADPVGTCFADGDCAPGLVCLLRRDGLPGDPPAAAAACAGDGAGRGWCVVDRGVVAAPPWLASDCDRTCAALLRCDPAAPTQDRDTPRFQSCLAYCAFLGTYGPTAVALTNVRTCVDSWADQPCGRLRASCAPWADQLAAAAEGPLVGVRYDAAPIRMPVSALVEEVFDLADGCVAGAGECSFDRASTCGGWEDTGCAGGGHSRPMGAALLLLAGLALALAGLAGWRRKSGAR